MCRKIKLLFSIVLLLVIPVGLHSDNAELYFLFRSSNWNSIIQHFKKKTPVSKEHNFIFAKALEKEAQNDTNYKEIIKLYLASAGLECNSDLNLCLDEYKNVHGTISNFSLLKAQNIAKKQKDIPLQLKILLKGDYSKNDLITKTLYKELIHFLYFNYDIIQQKDRDIIFYIIDDSKYLETPLSNYYLAKVYKRINQNNKAYYYYFHAGLNSKNEWILKAIWHDLKSEFNHIPVEFKRNLVIFYFDTTIKNHLNFSNEQIIATTNANTLFYDGKYFIFNNDWDSMYKLINKNYSFISQNPDILNEWLSDIFKKKQYHLIQTIAKILNHIKHYNNEIWKTYLFTLKELSKNNENLKEQYFYEVLNYLKYNHYDIQIYDELMDFLIIKKDMNNLEKFEYAPRKYWEQAFKVLPHQTEAGRFYYWLYRYYKYELKDEELSKMILDNFYYYAPGSYYIQAIWDEIHAIKPKDYKIDWNHVHSLTNYYQWIVKHGSNDNALLFLSEQNLSNFYNTKALELVNILKRDVYIPEEILFLFQFNEFEYGLNIFKDYYKNKSTEIEYLKTLVLAGQKSSNKFIEVYYLRQLIRKLNIPEDPFTLPPYLLEKLYPRPYRNLVQIYSNQFKIHEDYVYALMRQESMFREDAISRSGAKGLMQIMPKTGEWLNAKLKLHNYNLLHPETSIIMGTKFFSDLLKNYNNDFRWASIAYNGGPGNLKKWKNQYFHGDFNYFLEVLPNQESRNYCRKTYQNYLHYKISRLLYDQGIRNEKPI